MNESWIELEDVHLDRGGRPVLQGMSVSLAGRAIGLVGANGAGKSTLIGALLGVLRHRRGRIRVLGLDVPAHAREVRTRAGVMAEQAGIYPGGSGVDAVTFAGTLSGLPRREALRHAHRVLDALDVGEERYRPAKTYSTGMRQRCKLAMCLVHDPEVLILDEPTVGLDPAGRAQLLALIQSLKEEGRRILLSTHILQDADGLCDDLLLLESGMVSYAGPIEGIVSSAAGTIVAAGAGLGRLVGSLEAAQIRILAQDADRITFVSKGDEDLRTFWQLVGAQGLEVRHLGREALTLEDAVVSMMEKSHG